jgi:alginate O-acetyltransferase complex protein AlgI
MLFNSFQFLLFFLVFCFLYYLFPRRFRLPLIFLGGCFFYMSFIPQYILILFVLIAVDYAAGRLIQTAPGREKKGFLLLSLAANLLFLGIFKYYNFFIGLPLDLPLKILLPIGLSFHTFQSMSYTIEVFRGKQKAEKNLLVFACYVLFFPQLVAGPIERPGHLLPQLKKFPGFDPLLAGHGLKLMAWGLFKKVVIADRLALFVNPVFAAPQQYSGVTLLMGTVFFAFQIFCDFSGYSDIAVGAAEVLGFHLSLNFLRPYFAKSLPDFWRRWHISLSGWFRDYVYFPLGGNRVGKLLQQRNILLVFLLSGIWHGANWTFLAWGAAHGLFYALSKNWPARLAAITTFPFVCLAWILFRANSLADAGYIFRHLSLGLGGYGRFVLAALAAHNFSPIVVTQLFAPLTVGLAKKEFVFALAGIGFLLLTHLWERPENNIVDKLDKNPAVIRWAFLLFIVMATLNLGIIEEIPFIYFQF